VTREARPAAATDERVCPQCRATVTPVPIVYGYPGPEMFRAYERGEIRLGGCVITGDDSQFACPACDAPLPTTKPADPPRRTN
jgi:hypothetical protein